MSAAADQEDTSDGTAASRKEVLEPSSSDGDPMSACHQEAEASPDVLANSSSLQQWCENLAGSGQQPSQLLCHGNIL